MKNLIFYFEPEWAFGTIHYELCKYLFRHRINAHVLAWNRSYSVEEMRETDKTVDVFVTNPHGYKVLTDDYAISAEKIVVVAHAVLDLQYLIEMKGLLEFEKPKAFAVVSEFLKQRAGELRIQRIPTVLPLGVNLQNYNYPVSNSLRTVGFAGSFHSRNEFPAEYANSPLAEPRTRKRGYLVSECASIAGLKFKVAQQYHNSFVTMPGFYKDVDCVVIASSEEGAGLPALEGGAAGRLVISTPVGHWPERCQDGGGLTVPIEEAQFMGEVIKLLMHYSGDPAGYKAKCLEIKRYSRNYDWSKVISKWIEVIIG